MPVDRYRKLVPGAGLEPAERTLQTPSRGLAKLTHKVFCAIRGPNRGLKELLERGPWGRLARVVESASGDPRQSEATLLRR